MKSFLQSWRWATTASPTAECTNLIKSIKSNSDYKVYAIGGNQLKKVADEFIQDIVNINGFGFFPIRQVFFLKKIFKTVKKYLIEKKVNKVILVDYYGFNIHVAKLAHELKIPVYYFVTPQVWASRKYRIKNIAKYVNVAFPNFSIYVPRGGKLPLLNIAQNQVAGQMGRLGHDNREESGCARS